MLEEQMLAGIAEILASPSLKGSEEAIDERELHVDVIGSLTSID